MNILKCYLITQKRPTIFIMIFLSLFVDTYDEISSLVMAFIAVLGKDIFSFGDKWWVDIFESHWINTEPAREKKS